MAIADTLKLWKDHMNKKIAPFNRKHMVKALGAKYVYELTLGGTDGKKAFRKGATSLLGVKSQYKTAYLINKSSESLSLWSRALATVNNDIKSSGGIAGYSIKQSRYDPVLHKSGKGGTSAHIVPELQITDDELVIQMYRKGRNSGDWAKNIMNEYRDRVWDAWVDILADKDGHALTPSEDVPLSGEETERVRKSGDVQAGTVSNLLKYQVTGDHRENSTRALSALKEMKKAKPTFATSLDFTELDIIADIEDRMTITYNEEARDKTGGGVTKGKSPRFQWDSYIEVRLGSRKPEDTDKDKIYDAAKNAVTERIKAQIKKHGLPAGFIDEPQSRYSKRQQVINAVTHDIVNYYKKAAKAKVEAVGGKPFKANKVNVKIHEGGGGRFPTKKKKKVSIAGVPLKSRGKESGQGEQAATALIAELGRAKTYINKRLPAEVRRNMGRPALINRTGMFSGSAKLLSLRPAANSIVAKYTYMLTGGGASKNRQGVYETFENTGSKSWPLGYNPKPLIAKSIRNLAKGRIRQKLTLRRS